MKTSFLTAALISTSFAAPALAGAPGVAVTERVSYADLDLSTASGRAALDARVRRAVYSACGAASEADPRGGNQVRRCRADARLRAGAQTELASARRPAATIASR